MLANEIWQVIMLYNLLYINKLVKCNLKIS